MEIGVENLVASSSGASSPPQIDAYDSGPDSRRGRILAASLASYMRNPMEVTSSMRHSQRQGNPQSINQAMDGDVYDSDVTGAVGNSSGKHLKAGLNGPSCDQSVGCQSSQ